MFPVEGQASTDCGKASVAVTVFVLQVVAEHEVVDGRTLRLRVLAAASEVRGSEFRQNG